MATLAEIQEAADQLNVQEQVALITHLLAGLPSAFVEVGDEEILRREAEMDSGAVKTLSHEEFLAAVGRR